MSNDFKEGLEMAALSRKERDRRLRRDDILRAAEHIFAIKGYHKASMNDIAREAQYAVGTVYLYFKDKEILYITIFEQKTQELFSGIKSMVARVAGGREKIKVLIEEQLAYFEKNKDFFKIYFSERVNYRWAIKDRISQKAAEKFLHYIDYVSSLIREAQVEKVIRNDLPAKKIAFILTSMINAVIFPWLRQEAGKGTSAARSGGNGKSLKEMSGFILDLFFNGVKAR
jgi:AcrR family transcriptional regulator